MMVSVRFLTRNFFNKALMSKIPNQHDYYHGAPLAWGFVFVLLFIAAAICCYDTGLKIRQKWLEAEKEAGKAIK